MLFGHNTENYIIKLKFNIRAFIWKCSAVIYQLTFLFFDYSYFLHTVKNAIIAHNEYENRFEFIYRIRIRIWNNRIPQ